MTEQTVVKLVVTGDLYVHDAVTRFDMMYGGAASRYEWRIEITGDTEQQARQALHQFRQSLANTLAPPRVDMSGQEE